MPPSRWRVAGRKQENEDIYGRLPLVKPTRQTGTVLGHIFGVARTGSEPLPGGGCRKFPTRESVSCCGRRPWWWRHWDHDHFASEKDFAVPRQPRPDLAGIPQHVVQRGNNRQACFYREADYLRYLTNLREAAARYGCHVHAYVLGRTGSEPPFAHPDKTASDPTILPDLRVEHLDIALEWL
jgi:hypothetical protein